MTANNWRLHDQVHKTDTFISRFVKCLTMSSERKFVIQTGLNFLLLAVVTIQQDHGKINISRFYKGH